MYKERVKFYFFPFAHNGGRFQHTDTHRHLQEEYPELYELLENSPPLFFSQIKEKCPLSGVEEGLMEMVSAGVVRVIPFVDESNLPLQLSIDTLDGICPVEANGKIEGKPFYFQARGDSWSFHIEGENSWSTSQYWGPFPSAGYMTRDEALACILTAFHTFKRQSLGSEYRYS